MSYYQTLIGHVRDVLKETKTLDDNFLITHYNAYEHRVVVPQLYARTLHKAPLKEDWDTDDSFYGDGIYLIFHKEDRYYVGFALSKIQDDIPYISAMGIIDEFRGYGVGTYLVQQVTKHYAKMGYAKVMIDVKSADNIIEYWAQMGFTKVEEN